MFQFAFQLSDNSRAIPVAQTAKPVVSRASKPAGVGTFQRPANLKIGDTVVWKPLCSSASQLFLVLNGMRFILFRCPRS